LHADIAVEIEAQKLLENTFLVGHVYRVLGVHVIRFGVNAMNEAEVEEQRNGMP
jgi:hypothetical protein